MTVAVADAEPIVFKVDASQEAIFRKAAHSVNELWNKWRAADPGKSSHYVLAKVALAFAELSYLKSEQLDYETTMLADYEKELDEILLKMEG